MQSLPASLRNWYCPADPAIRQARFDQLAMTYSISRTSALPAIVNVLCIAALAMQWHSLAFVGSWAASATVIILATRYVIRPMAEQATTADLYAWRNAVQAAGSVIFVLSFASSGPLFWVPGDALNHLVLLLVLMVSGALGVAQTGAHPPLGVNSFLYVATAITLCLAEGGYSYMILAFLGGVLLLMLWGLMMRATVRTEQMLALRYSERALLEKQKELVTELQDANRAKAEFLARMSHELRTPLNAVIGFSDVMRQQMMGPIGTPVYLEYLRDIGSSGAHLLKLINEILDLSKIEAGRLELSITDIHVHSQIDDAIAMVRLRAEEGGVRLVNDVPSGIVLSGDETALQQIVINLTANAIKFTPHGGSVRWTGACDASGVLTLCVEDTGSGICPDDLELVFEAFGQGRHDIAAKERGTGLGLPIVRGLMKAHGGDVSIESTLGQGTRVTLTFPASQTAALDEAA